MADPPAEAAGFRRQLGTAGDERRALRPVGAATAPAAGAAAADSPQPASPVPTTPTEPGAPGGLPAPDPIDNAPEPAIPPPGR